MHSQQTLTASPGSPHSRQAMDSEEGHGGSVSFRVAPLQQTFNEHAAVGTTGHFHPQQPPQAMDERPVKFSKDQLRESVARWLKENYKLSYDRSIEKKVLYEEYLALCRARNWEPTTPAAFGRIVRKAFPWVSSCRRGSRGNTSHHYTHLQSKAEAESCLQQNDGQSSFSFSAVPPSGAASFTHHTAAARYNSDDMNVEVKEEDMMFKERRHMMPPPQHHHHLSNGAMQPRHQDEDDDDAVSPRASAHHNSAMGYSWDPAAYEAQNALGGLGGGFQHHHQPPQEGSLPQQQQFSMFQQQSGYPYNLPNSWPQERQAPYTTTIAATMTAGSPCATGVGGVGAYTNAATSFSAPSHHTTSSSLHPLGHYSRSASSVFPDLGSAQESELEFRKGFGSAPQKHTSFSSSYHHPSSAQQRHHSLHPHHNQGRQYIEAFQRSQQQQQGMAFKSSPPSSPTSEDQQQQGGGHHLQFHHHHPQQHHSPPSHHHHRENGREWNGTSSSAPSTSSLGGGMGDDDSGTWSTDSLSSHSHQHQHHQLHSRSFQDEVYLSSGGATRSSTTTSSPSSSSSLMSFHKRPLKSESQQPHLDEGQTSLSRLTSFPGRLTKTGASRGRRTAAVQQQQETSNNNGSWTG